jgi:hypothetical protein
VVGTFFDQALLAQTTGRVRGQVTDPEGVAIPGVAVTIRSEVLVAGARKATTGESGAVRFSALPPGVYRIRAEMAGFQTRFVEGIRVSANATATARLVLYPEFAEELSVTLPLVDVSSSGTSTTYTAEFAQDLPTNRNFWDLFSASPGISPALGTTDRQVAFGSNMQSNAWKIDGIDAGSPETGSAWVYVNPDMVEELQVLGIGAPAEFGNMLGATFNVVTKSGTNRLKSTVNVYWQDDSLTDSDIDFDASEYSEFERSEFWNIAATLGGPIKKDRLWFFGAYQFSRDALTYPGQDPSFVPVDSEDRYDLKLTTRIGDGNLLDLKGYYEVFEYEDSYAFAEPSALGGLDGDIAAWGLNHQYIVSDRLMVEAGYYGWASDGAYLSQTGSSEPAYYDLSPPGGGPITYSGGLLWPWAFDSSSDQLSVKVSHFADDFLAGDHDFRFGIEFSTADSINRTSPSATGSYYYHYAYNYEYSGAVYRNDYYFKVEGLPYFYGSEQESWSAFIDDSWAVSDRFTLNLGVRFDHHRGSVPSFERLAATGEPTGAWIPGVDPVFTWDNWSPRLGFAYNAGADRKTVIRGSLGVYYDGNVSGNWNFPPPSPPELNYYWSSSLDGPWEFFWNWTAGRNIVDPDLDAPRSLQYALGFERQIRRNCAVGVMAIYKDTSDLIGWEILDDGLYQEIPFTDPITGRKYTLLDPIEFPTTRKGNQPGATVDPAVDEYWQEYWGVIFTFDRRFADWWALKASYTRSESKGLIPSFLSQLQFDPFHGAREGSDPNSFLNAEEQLLQGDRSHMFRVQAKFELPWNLHVDTVVNLQSGRPYSRQVLLPTTGRPPGIMEPAGDSQRHPFQSLIDFGIGKRITLPGGGVLKLDLQVLNILNEDAVTHWDSLVLDEGEDFLPFWWVWPRRLMLRLGYEY